MSWIKSNYVQIVAEEIGQTSVDMHANPNYSAKCVSNIIYILN